MTHAEPTARDYGVALIEDSKVRFLEEFLPRILKCLDELSDDDIWTRPNDNVVSVGNLILHLCGNVRQYVISGLGGKTDTRERDREFDEQDPLPRAELVGLLESTLREVEETLNRLDPETLLETRHVQGEEQTVLIILTHVVEHFSYHVGQISLHVKLRKEIDLAYYAGRDLNLKNRGSDEV